VTPTTRALGLARRSQRQAGSAMAEVAAAASFLTRLPIPRSATDLERTGAAAFALVGAAIGLAGGVPMLLLGPRLPLPAAVMSLAVLVIASGALHLDGLSDTADALAAPTPDTAERARTDPRVGAAGATAIGLDLLLGASLLATIAAVDTRVAVAALVVGAAASRAAAPVAAWIVASRGRRPRGGLGGWFGALVTTSDVVVTVASTIAVVALAALLAGTSVPTGAATGAVVAAIAGAAVVARRGQLDGDGYGAIVEITFLAILAGVAIQLPVA
jgi:adenosylcobinamide-GDP ribazoletransferase